MIPINNFLVGGLGEGSSLAHQESRGSGNHSRQDDRWYGHSHKVSKFVAVPVPEECALAKFNVATFKNKNQIPENKNDLYLQVPARNKSVKCAARNTNINIPVPTPTKKEFRLPSANWEPDSDDEDTSKPVVELPEGPRPFKLAFTNWIDEMQYEWDIHSKLMSLNHGTVVNVSNILHPEFWRDDINDASLTDYIVPFCPLRFSSKIFKF